MPAHGLGHKMGWSLVGYSFSICFISVPAILGQRFSRWFSVPSLHRGSCVATAGGLFRFRIPLLDISTKVTCMVSDILGSPRNPG